jgi:DNA-binding transcriptional ArsR family regulator
MKEDQFRTVSLLKAIANPVRYKIIFELKDKELTVSEIAEKVDKEPNIISQHLRILRQERIVRFKTCENRVFYRLKNTRILEVLKELNDIVQRGND